MYSNKLNGVYPIICTHGNLKLSGLLLLDKLVKGGAAPYYSGDLDINGILIANSLKLKYKERLHIWRMEVEEYHKSFSNVILSSKAIERLSFKPSEYFYGVSIEMKKIKKAGYQERLIPQYLADISEMAKFNS